MKNIIISFLILTFCCSVACGQSSANENAHAGKYSATVQKAADELNSTVMLSKDQYAKVLEVFEAFYNQSKAQEAPRQHNNQADGKAIADKVMISAQIRDEQLKTILTLDQCKKWISQSGNQRPDERK